MGERAVDDAVVAAGRPRIRLVVLLGITQILAWGGSYYLPAVLAVHMSRDTGWPISTVFAGLSLGLLVSGLCAPRVGRNIDRLGGRHVLVAGSLLLALGLAMLGLAQSLALFFAAWLVLGLGMAMGLYDAAFGVIGRLIGSQARPSITGVTLFGGFAVTVSWPLLAGLEAELGWRGACFAFAGIQLFFSAPAHLLLVPKLPPPRPAAAGAAAAPAPAAPTGSARSTRWLFVLVALVVATNQVIATTVGAHLLNLLGRLGFDAVAALALGALIGPGQVGARIVEFSIGRKLHPVWTARIGVTFTTAGLALLMLAGGPLAAVAILVYGAGNGVNTIAKGTLPLALFGPVGYAGTVGRLVAPALVAQSAAPWLSGLLFERITAEAAFGCLLAAALFGIALTLCLPARGQPPAR